MAERAREEERASDKQTELRATVIRYGIQHGVLRGDEKVKMSLNEAWQTLKTSSYYLRDFSTNIPVESQLGVKNRQGQLSDSRN